MKYQIKVRKTIIKETIVEVNFDRSAIAAMDFAEALMESHPPNAEPAHITTEGKWTAVAVTSGDKDE